MDKNRLPDAARNNIVTIMFIVLCAVCMAFSGYAPNYVLYELFGRLSRNMFIVLSLIIPIVAGMGINFAITIGAMAAQIACLLVLEWGVPGIGGLALADRAAGRRFRLPDRQAAQPDEGAGNDRLDDPGLLCQRPVSASVPVYL